MALRRSRGGSNEPRPFVFPSLKVDGELWTQEVVIPNRGQGMMAAQQEAAKVIRQRRAAMAAAEATVPAGEDSPESTVPTGGDSQAVSSADLVDVSQVLSPKTVDATIREWLAAHLPSAEQLFAASASLVGLQGIDARVRDLVASFQEGLDSYRAAFTSWFESVQGQWAALVANGEATLQQWSDQIAEVSRWRDDLEQRLFAAIADKRGPKGDLGNTGMAGAATTVVDRLPKGKGPDFLIPYIGRSAVVGDIAIDASTVARFAWRWDGQSWERGPSMTSIQVRDVRVNSMDAAPRITVTGTASSTSGGATSGGGERLLVRALPRASYQTISDASRWGSALVARPDASTINSATISMEIAAADGAFMGQRAVLHSVLTFEPDGTGVKIGYSEFSVLGELASIEGFNPRFQVQFVRPRVPTGVRPAPTYPDALRVPIIELQVDATATGKPSNYLLSGYTLWNLPFPAVTRPKENFDVYRSDWEV